MNMSCVELRKRILEDRIGQLEEIRDLIKNEEAALAYGAEPVRIIQNRIDVSRRELNEYEQRRD